MKLWVPKSSFISLPVLMYNNICIKMYEFDDLWHAVINFHFCVNVIDVIN